MPIVTFKSVHEQKKKKKKKKKKVHFLTLAAPVLLGMMLKLAALPPLQSLADGPSTVFWVAERIHTHHVKIKTLNKILH